MQPYSKAQQLNIKAGTPECDALLKKLKPKKNKFNAKKAEGIKGRSYDSQMERDFANLLEMERLEGKYEEIREQVCLKLEVNGELVCKYHIDFITIDKEGRYELWETKGKETRDWKVKWDLTKALLPKGQIQGIPKDARLLLVKKGTRGKWIIAPQLLDYE